MKYKRAIKGFFTVMLIGFFMVMYVPLQALAGSTSTALPKVQFASQPQTEYMTGDTVNFNLHSPGYKGKVQYRAVLWHDETKSYRDLWEAGDKYYTKWMPYGNEIFNLHWKIDKPGHYRITIYAKRSGLPNNKTAQKNISCDSYMPGIAFVVKDKNPIGVELGTSMDDVKKVLGQPIKSKTDKGIYVMEYSDVTLFLDKSIWPFKVCGWSNKGNAKVSIGLESAAAEPIKLGSLQSDVIKAMGSPRFISPYKIDNETAYWVYEDDSMIFFDDNNNVSGYINNGDLKVSLGAQEASGAVVAMDSKASDVVRAMGTPKAVNAFYSIIDNDEGHVFDLDVDYGENAHYYTVSIVREGSCYQYGNSLIIFDPSQKVVNYLNQGDLRISLGEIDSNSMGIRLYSAHDEVVKALGTPDAVLDTIEFPQIWVYGESYVGFDTEQKVAAWYNKGSLKVSSEYETPTMEPITIGSSRSQVISSMGVPTEFLEDRWIYGDSTVYFSGEYVSGIDNRGKNIVVSSGEFQTDNSGFALGASFDDVMNAMGSPDRVARYNKNYIYWQYGSARVYFDKNGEAALFEGSKDLNIRMDPAYEASASAVRIGSDASDISRAMGRPDKIFISPSGGIVWTYGEGKISLDAQGKVSGWDNKAGNLKVLVDEKDPEAAPFTIGSTMEQVSKAMGTPWVIRIEEGSNYIIWEYDGAWVAFKDGRMNAWEDRNNILKLAKGSADASLPPLKVGVSTKEDVLKKLGTPSSITFEMEGSKTIYEMWFYGNSFVRFDMKGIMN